MRTPRMNILFVEAHAVFAATMTRQFLSKHSVTVVPGLCAAREALAGGVFDLLLVVYDLDAGNGDKLVRELRDSGKPLVIIGVSSHEKGNAVLLKESAVAI